MKPKSPSNTGRTGEGESPRIICGTDFSENARQAARVAAAVARRLAEPVLLIHAVDAPSIKPRTRAELIKLLTASRRRSLLEEAKRIRETGVTVHEQTPVGRADEVLVNLSRKETTRLLVVSSLSRRGAAHWFLGSVAERTAERATVPTLVVRDAAPFESWTSGKRPLKVFVCFNGTVTSEAALRWVKDWAALGPCEVVIGCVCWPPEQWARFGDTASEPFDGNSPEVQSVLERDVRAKAGELLGKIPFRLRVEANWGRTDGRLAEMAKEEGADLVVVGSHQYQGFERLWHTSVSRGLLHQAAMSVAVVPLATDKERGTRIAPPVRRVLVTTDFSELANSAIPSAYSILRGGGTVHLLHVVAESFVVPGGGSDCKSSARGSNTPEARHIQECAAKLRTLIPPEAAAQGISTQVEVTKSPDVAEGICQSAERLGVDVICLGTHGRSGLSKALMGSVAQKVMSLSRRPLFVVRPQVQ